MFQVRDVLEKEIDGFFTFDCDGFIVRCSSLAKSQEILIFKKQEGTGKLKKAVHIAKSVTDAVLWCWANKKCEEVCPKNCLHCQEPCSVRI